MKICLRFPLVCFLLIAGGAGCDFKDKDEATGGGDEGTGGEVVPVCEAGASDGDVQEPEHIMRLGGETSWFASPVVYDLDGDGKNELIAAYYSVFVFDSDGNLLHTASDGESRVYAPHVVADLDGDGTTEVVAGNGEEVYAWEWTGVALTVKQGWPVDTTTAGESPEVRGMSAADLNGDGEIEVVVTTTQTQKSADGGAQVFVYSPDGTLYQPSGGHDPAWPRYNARSGQGNDADRNGKGHNGFGCYGLNVGIGNIDDDKELEIIATYDNHHIQAFDHDGVAIDTAPWFTNRATEFDGERLTWGQFIRWADPQVEANHYHEHTGEWPHPDWTEWLQWTASPPNVVDLDLDGKNEVLGVPNIEMYTDPYETQAYGIMVLEGSHGDGGRSGMRKAGWEVLPRGDKPIDVDGWYPPGGVPAATAVSVNADEKPEIMVSLNDGHFYQFGADGKQIWRVDYRHGKSVMYASEMTVADLNQDGSPELLFATYGDPDTNDSGNLMILGANGERLHDIPLPDPGHNGNGNGAPAAPTVGDLDGDGQLEIFVQTFEHGMDVFTVPGSSTNCVLWSTARGGPLRTGRAHTAP
ncbi:MAG: VCBS repeat-containing protein [Deltaproteobacteria bacterium]|nr:VCBS repeat-containing protein [Deltaproteobacteria bacterium]